MSDPVCTCYRGGHAHTPVAECPTHRDEPQSGVRRPLRQRLVDEARSARREAQAGMWRYKEALLALDKAGIPRSVAYRDDEG